MLSQKPLKIIYQNDDYWFPQVAPQLNASYDETTLTFDNEVGKGDFFKVDIEPGLRVRRIEVQFHKPVIFMRKSTTNPGYYVLVSNLSEQYLETTTCEKSFKLGYSSENGIYFSSPFIAASYTFRPGVPYHLVFVVLNHERVQNFIDRQPGTQKDLLITIIDKKNPIYHFECMDGQFMAMLKEMDSQLNVNRPNNLLLHAKTLELCYHMLQRVQQRQSKGFAKRIHHEDISKLNEIKKVLMERYQEPCPPIEKAAKRAAMSPTKFKTLFRQVFGDTYYQFYKNVRMHKARELLRENKMNVSEVGYMLGYQNLSKFSKAFKDVFAVAPGEMAGA